MDAWSYVNHELLSKKDQSANASFARFVRPFAANWSSDEFIKFVDDLASLVDDLHLMPGSDEWKRAEGLWERVVELESEFWPQDGEEKLYKLL